MRFEITPAAQADLAKLPKADAARIVKALAQVVATHPQRMPFVTEIVGRPGVWRLKKGDYRAIFTVDSDTVIVTGVGHRKDIYR